MADSLLDNYNPLYDIHLRQYFALPHMQKHLQKMGLLESTLNLNGDEVYARHHAMMDMMLKNREAQLLKMAELRKKLDAAEKIEICRRIRTGQSPESYRRGKPSRSLSRNRAAQKGGSGRQRRFSNSYEDRDFVQHIEERNADPDDYDTRDPYKRLSANAKRFNYLHKLDDNTLIAYKDNLKKQLQRLERFREISFGPHSVARQPPPPQASWFFRRRSVLNMRGRKTTTGNKLNASHDSRTSCPPTTRKRKDSNTRLPPINPQKGRVATKPPAPVSLQQITTKLPPAAKKPAPSRGRPSNKRQTTTTTTTTITTSKSPTSTLPILPSVTGHGIFTGAAAAATVAAIGTAAITVNDLISDEPKRTPTPSPPSSPVLETQKTIDRSSPTNEVHHEDLPADILEQLAVESEKVPDQEVQEFDDHIARQIVLDNAPVDRSHGDYEDSDSEPEYAEEDRESPEQEFVRQEVQQVASPPSSTEPLTVHAHTDNTVSPPVSDTSVPAQLESPQELSYSAVSEPVVTPPSQNLSEKEVARSPSVHSPTLPSPVAAPESPALSPVHAEHEFSPPSPVQSVHSSHASEHVEQHHEASLPSPVQSVHSSHASEHVEHLEHFESQQSPVLSVRSSHGSEHFEQQIPTLGSPVASEKNIPTARSPSVQEAQDEIAEVEKMSAPQSPALSMHGSHISELSAEPAHFNHQEAPQSPVLSLTGSQLSEHPAEAAQQSPVLSVHSHHAVEHFEQHDAVPQSPVLSVHGSHVSEHHEDAAPQSPILSVHVSEHSEESHHGDIPQSPAVSIHSSHHSEHIESYEPAVRSPSVHSEHQEEVPISQSPALSVHSSHASEHQTPQSPMDSVHAFEKADYNVAVPQSPVIHEDASRSPSVHSDREPTPQSPVLSVHSSHTSELVEQEPAVSQSRMSSVHASEEVDNEVPDLQSPVTSGKNAFAVRSSSVHSDHVPTSQSPVLSVHSSHVPEHEVAAPPSPIVSEKDVVVARTPSVHEDESIAEVQYVVPAHEVPESPVGETRTEHFAPPIPQSPSVHTSDASENEHEEETFEVQHHVPLSHSPVVEDADPASVPAPHSPTAMDLYNPSHGNMESPVLSDAEHELEHAPAPQSPVIAPTSPRFSVEESEATTGVAIADRIDLEANHNSPTKESTSPVVANPVEIHVTPEQVAEQLSSPEQVAETRGSFEDIINKSADEEASHLIQEALTEAPAIIDMVNTYEERFSPQVSPRQETDVSPLVSSVTAPVHEPEAYELKYDDSDSTNAMMTSIYQPSSDHEGSQTSLSGNQPETQIKLNEWDEGDKHVQETTTHSEFTEGNTHHTYSETVTVITDNDHNGQTLESPKTSEISPNGAGADNISTDSLIIHDDHEASDYQMTQSVYQPREEVEEKEWDEGNKHVHEISSNMEHTDESGKHYTETVTTTTTVIKSGDDLKNNNDDEDGDHSDDQDDKSIEEEERGSNGNLVRETITTTTHTVTSGGLPEGGILVDDGDETNISSI